MNIIAWLLLGLIAGWLTSVIMKTNDQQGMLGDIVLGVLGAFLGGFIFTTFGGSGVTGLDLYSLMVAVLGAVLLIGIKRAVT